MKKKNTAANLGLSLILLVTSLSNIKCQDSHVAISEPINKNTEAEKPRGLDKDTATNLPEIPVDIYIVRKQNLVKNLEVNGIFKALKDEQIVPQVSGRIEDLYISDGKFVRQDSILLKINGDLYEAELRIAEENFKKSLVEYGERTIYSSVNSEYNRNHSVRDVSNLQNGENINDIDAKKLFMEYDRNEIYAITTGLNRNRLLLKIARINMEHTAIRAPFDGYIADLEAFEGGRVKAQMPILRLVSLDPIGVDVDVLEKELVLLREGTKVRVWPVNFSDYESPGTIKSISPVIDAEKGTVKMSLTVDNKKLVIKPGMLAKIRIEYKDHGRRLLVPKEAVLKRDGRLVVFVYSGGKAEWRYIQKGLENDKFVEIKEGVALGDSVTVSGHFYLSHQARIRLSR